MLFVQDELINVLGFVSRFYTTLGVRQVAVDLSRLEDALGEMRAHLDRQPGGIDGASPFKKAATFVCHFVEANPIKSPLPPKSTLGAALATTMGTVPDQNVVVALRIAMESLHGAELRRADGKVFELTRRLDLSRDSYVEIVDALTDATPDHYSYVAVLLEQLAYKTNPRCQDPSYQVSNYDSPECRLEPIIGREDLMDVWAGKANIEVVRRDGAPAFGVRELTAVVEESRASGELDVMRTRVPFHYRQSRSDPALVDRVALDGTFTTGRFFDGVFVEERVRDVS